MSGTASKETGSYDIPHTYCDIFTIIMAIFNDSVEITTESTSVARFLQYILKTGVFSTWKEVFHANTGTSKRAVVTVVAPVNRAPSIMLKSTPKSSQSYVSFVFYRTLALFPPGKRFSMQIRALPSELW
jgi:hypothetical protein